jgi:PAS domain-containing protein
MQHAIELILLRQWASYISLPVFLMDASGTLIFYNEAAEDLLGARFDDAGEMAVGELARIFKTTAIDGAELPAESLPIHTAVHERRPAHATLRVTALDGQGRTLEVTAFPVEGQANRHLGAVAMFWEPLG